MRFINPSYNHEKFPRFIFSLPRSGSTLLQRVLMSHRDIASVSEPWFLLPFSYAYKKEGILTEYSHGTSYAAFEDFINNLPNKEDDYYQALGGFANKLYQKQCFNDEKYFLDKTPRYYNIIPEIAKSFPEAKFIFLFRNPVHVMSSMMKTWGEGRFCAIGDYVRTGLGKHPTKDFVSIHPAFFSLQKPAGFTFVKEQLFDEHDYVDNDKQYYVVIGNDVWIGNNVLIMDGVSIGDGAIVAAGAIVTKDVKPYAIVAGIPAKVINNRFNKEQVKKLLEIKWWDWTFIKLSDSSKDFTEFEKFLKVI